MSTKRIPILSSAVIAIVLLAASSGLAQEQETTCYSGVSVILGPDGTVFGQMGQLISRTYQPAQSQLIETVINYDSFMGQPPSEVPVTVAIEGSTFTFSAEGVTGHGEMVGEAWAWSSWTTEATGPGGMQIFGESELTADGQHSSTRILDSAGNLAMLMEDTATSVDCETWEQLSVSAMAGELRVESGDVGGSGEAVTQADGVTAEEVVSYREEELALTVGERTVHGTMTYPAGEGPFPALMLIAGSGPTDRDWNNPMIPGNNGSARLLAHLLAENGYVVWRYDKLATGQSTELPPGVMLGTAGLTLNDFMAEQIAGVRYLEADPLVDGAHIFVGGSSEGGTYALRLAEETELPIAGIITLAGAARPQGVVVTQQIHAQLVAAEMHTPEQIEEIVTAFSGALNDFAETGTSVNPADVTDIVGLQQLLVAYMNPASVELARWLISYDPSSSFPRFEIPVLIVQGEKDQQVHPELDGAALYAAAQAAGRTNVTLALCPNADHVLKFEETPVDELSALTAMRYNANGRVLDPDVVTAVLGWLGEQTGRTAPATAE